MASSWKTSRLLDSLLIPQPPTSTSPPPPPQLFELRKLVVSLPAADRRTMAHALARRLRLANSSGTPLSDKVTASALRASRVMAALLSSREGRAMRREVQEACGSELRRLADWRGSGGEGIRKAAEEALEAMYSEDGGVDFDEGNGVDGSTPCDGGGLGGRIEGFGSDSKAAAALGGPRGGPSGASGGMVGFGSDSYQSFQSGPSRSGGFMTFGKGDSSNNNGPAPPPVGYGSSSSSSSSFHPPFPAAQSIPSVSISATPSTSVAEEALVSDMCSMRGMGRVQPSAVEMKSFVEKAGTMDGTAMAAALKARLVGSEWRAAFRALCFIDATVRHGSTAACGEIVVAFSQNPEPLRALLNSQHASVVERARMVLEVVGGVSANEGSSFDDRVGEQHLVAPPDSSVGDAPPEMQMDLLGSLGAEMSRESTLATPAAVVAARPDADLFSGMSMQADPGLVSSGATSLAPNIFSDVHVMPEGTQAGGGGQREQPPPVVAPTATVLPMTGMHTSLGSPMMMSSQPSQPSHMTTTPPIQASSAGMNSMGGGWPAAAPIMQNGNQHAPMMMMYGMHQYPPPQMMMNGTPPPQMMHNTPQMMNGMHHQPPPMMNGMVPGAHMMMSGMQQQPHMMMNGMQSVPSVMPSGMPASPGNLRSPSPRDTAGLPPDASAFDFVQAHISSLKSERNS